MTLAAPAPIPTPPAPPPATSTSSIQYTPDDVLRQTDRLLELVDGQLVEKTMGVLESWIATEISYQLKPFEKRGLGFVMAETFVQAFPNEPRRVRRPDVCFAAAHHFPNGIAGVPPTLGFVPELVIEVESPNDAAGEVEARIDDYLDHGGRLVWVVFPRQRSVRVHRADGTIQRFRAADALTGESVLPDLKLTVNDILPPAPAPVAP